MLHGSSCHDRGAGSYLADASASDTRVVVLIAGYSPAHGNTPAGATRPCGSVTLITSSGRVMLVDTGREDALLLEAVAGAGVRPEQVDTVFLTHTHRDHCSCLTLLPRARVFASPLELADCRQRLADSPRAADGVLLARLEPAPAALLRDVRWVPTPGHTPGSASVLLRRADVTIAVCGDAVGNRTMFAERAPSANSQHATAERCSMDRLAAAVGANGVIVPGHGRPFRVANGLVGDEPEPGRAL